VQRSALLAQIMPGIFEWYCCGYRVQVLTVLSFAVGLNRGQVRRICVSIIYDSASASSHIRLHSCTGLPARYLLVTSACLLQVMSAKKDPEMDAVFKRKSAVSAAVRSLVLEH